jgi:hypothetical protein
MIILSLSFKLTESHSSTADVLPKHSNTSHSTNHYQGSAILSDKQRADRLRQAIRLCGSSIRTEKTYLPFLPPNAQGTTAPHNQALDARLIRSQEVSESPSAMDTPAALSTAPTSSPPTGTMRGAHPRPLYGSGLRRRIQNRDGTHLLTTFWGYPVQPRPHPLHSQRGMLLSMWGVGRPRPSTSRRCTVSIPPAFTRTSTPSGPSSPTGATTPVTGSMISTNAWATPTSAPPTAP